MTEEEQENFQGMETKEVIKEFLREAILDLETLKRGSEVDILEVWWLNTLKESKSKRWLSFFFFCLFAISRAALVACGGSQTRGLIRAAAAGLRQSHSNTGSEPGLQPTPQLTAMPDP